MTWEPADHEARPAWPLDPRVPKAPDATDWRALAERLAEALRDLLGTVIPEDMPDNRLSMVEAQSRTALSAYDSARGSGDGKGAK